MDDETEKELTELVCEIWAIRTVITELLADRLKRSNDPQKTANSIVKTVYKNYETSSFPEHYRLKIPEHIVSILDDATAAAPRRRRGRDA
jgi:hypothetical protein